MKFDRDKVLKAVCEHFNVPYEKRKPEIALVGWKEFQNEFNLSCVRYTQEKAYSNGFGIPWDLESSSSMTYVFEPPDVFAVLKTNPQDMFYHLNGDPSLIELQANIQICSSKQLSWMRDNGGPLWERYYDFVSRFPEYKDQLDGELGIDPPTKAIPIPVCWDRENLARWLWFRKKCIPIQRSQAARSKQNDEESRQDKTPTSQTMGALSYAYSRGIRNKQLEKQI